MTKEEAASIISGYEVYGCGYCLQGGDEVEEALRMAVDALKELPTVEAIPVEWINKYTNEHRTYMHAFSEMVACWYDEKEKHEYEMASDMRDYCEKYEPTYNPEDGSL